MIVGTGLIAEIVRHIDLSDKFIVHAAGVSDPLSTDQVEFDRDINSVTKSLSLNRPLLYFSSQGCKDLASSSHYYKHKKVIEDLILYTSPRSIIIRIPQVASSGGNPRNLLNFFYNSLLREEIIFCNPGAFQNLILDQHICTVVQYLTQSDLSGIFSFCSPYDYSAVEIIKCMEYLTGIKAKIKFHDSQQHVLIQNMSFCTSVELQKLLGSIFLKNRQSYLEWVISRAIST